MLKRIAVALLLIVLPLFSAPWDGTRGTLTVMTVGQDLSLIPSIAAHPTSRYLTWIFVQSTDPRINNVRVTISYRNERGAIETATRDADLMPSGLPWMAVYFPVNATDIIAEPFIEARAVSIVTTFGN